MTVSVENSADVTSLLTLSPTSFKFYVDQSGVTTKISTPEQFATLINRNLSGNYQLVNDIDMSSYAGFKGIAVNGTPFSGTLDGQGHKVSGLTVTYTDAAAMRAYSDRLPAQPSRILLLRTSLLTQVLPPIMLAS